jgi:acyl-CoA thioester hydrolase
MNPFRYYLRVRYSECDAQKIVFNARYGEYVDLAVTEFIRAIGLNVSGTLVDVDYQAVKQTAEWRAPARFDQVLEISVQPKHIGNTSFSLRSEFRIAGNEPAIATVETIYVNVEPKQLTKAPIPENVRAALARGAPGVRVDHAGYLRNTRSLATNSGPAISAKRPSPSRKPSSI